MNDVDYKVQQEKVASLKKQVEESESLLLELQNEIKAADDGNLRSLEVEKRKLRDMYNKEIEAVDEQIKWAVEATSTKQELTNNIRKDTLDLENMLKDMQSVSLDESIENTGELRREESLQKKAELKLLQEVLQLKVNDFEITIASLKESKEANQKQLSEAKQQIHEITSDLQIADDEIVALASLNEKETGKKLPMQGRSVFSEVEEQGTSAQHNFKKIVSKYRSLYKLKNEYKKKIESVEKCYQQMQNSQTKYDQSYEAFLRDVKRALVTDIHVLTNTIVHETNLINKKEESKSFYKLASGQSSYLHPVILHLKSQTVDKKNKCLKEKIKQNELLKEMLDNYRIWCQINDDVQRHRVSSSLLNFEFESGSS